MTTMIIIFKFLTISVLTFVLSNNHLGNEYYSPIAKEIGPEYFPVDSSLKLIYDSSLGEAISSIKIKEDNYILDMRNDDFFFVQTIQVQNDTVYVTELDQEVDVLLFISAGVNVTYNKPSLRFPFPLKIGDNWIWKGTEFIDDENPDSITVVGKVLGNELLETKAGNFDCVKFQIDIYKQSGTHTRFYEWRTPKIGLVKLEAYIDSRGFIGTVMSLLGYDEMTFALKKIL